jgi:hypothetical protein
MTFFFSQENSIFEAPQGPFDSNKSTERSTQVCYLPCFNDTSWNLIVGSRRCVLCQRSAPVVAQCLPRTHVCSYPDDVQVTGPDVDWNRIVAEAMQVLRENPSMFDIAEAYDYMAMTQDDTTRNDMTDMERQIREDESDTETDGDVPGLEEVPEDGDLPVLLPRNRINSGDSGSIGNEAHDDESTDSGVPELVPHLPTFTKTQFHKWNATKGRIKDMPEASHLVDMGQSVLKCRLFQKWLVSQFTDSRNILPGFVKAFPNPCPILP